MNLAEFHADRTRLYTGGLRWWIEHDCPLMRLQMEIPAGSTRERKAAHYRTPDTLMRMRKAAFTGGTI